MIRRRKKELGIEFFSVEERLYDAMGFSNGIKALASFYSRQDAWQWIEDNEQYPLQYHVTERRAA